MSLTAVRPVAPTMRQMPLDLGPHGVAGLDDFIVGDNAALMAWLQAWPEVDAVARPTYVWGPAGAGKTHLLRAMVERALARGWGAIWLNAQTCQMWDPVDPALPTLALIDECERLDANHQHLAFNLFIEAAASAALTPGTAPDEANGPLYILAAGDCPPVDLPVRDDLRTRLGWGLIYSLVPLDEAGVRRALVSEAARRGMSLPDDVLHFLLTRHSRNLGFLMALLDRLDRYALAEHRVLTVPLLKQMLAVESA